MGRCFAGNQYTRLRPIPSQLKGIEMNPVKLSLLSTAVLMALGGTHAGAAISTNQGRPAPADAAFSLSAHMHGQTSAGDSNIPGVPGYVHPWHSRADTRVGLAPRRGGRESRPPNIDPSGFVVPAYAADGADYVTLDVTAPNTTLTVIAAGSYIAGDFVNNDFTREYVIDYASGNAFGTVDTTTGVFTGIGTSTPNAGEIWTGLKWDPTTNTLYAVGTSCGSSSLYTIDPLTGNATVVGSPGGLGSNCMVSAAVDPNTGAMYGIDIIADTLVLIDKTMVNATQVIGPIGFNANFAQGLDFDDSTGILYLAGFDAGTSVDSIYTIDTTTGLATPIAQVGSGGSHQLVAFAVAKPSIADIIFRDGFDNP